MADTPGRKPSSDHSVDAIRRYYDVLGEGEYDRLTRDVAGRVSFEVHLRFLSRYLQPEQRVLEIGAGPGRFTSVLAERGARVVVTDLSPVQLRLNEANLVASGHEHAIEARHTLDVRDTSRFVGAAFDLVLAYGGPLSYVFGEEHQALTGLIRVVKPGGVVVASVMSLWGSWRARFADAAQLAIRHGTDVTDAVVRTGDLRYVPGMVHVCRMFTWGKLAALVAECGGELLGGSASNWASLQDPAVLVDIERSPQLWERFLAYETEACTSPGARDGGTHILFALRRPL
jgi:SAM-dependent methyltransferase